MATQTTYMKFPYIRQGNTDWLSQYNDMLSKMDTLGKYLRRQTSAGESMAMRCELADGSLIDAVRIVPDGNNVAIYLGRAGKNDRVIIENSSLYSAFNLANQNPTATDKTCAVGATWSDEAIGGDDIQDVTVNIDTRNNYKTTIQFPPADAPTITNPYLGSALQLGTDPSGIGTNTPHIKFTCQTTTGTRTYIVPAYSL